MGVWAIGLYAGDFALDLRSAISAVAKLPFNSDRLLKILCETEAAMVIVDSGRAFEFLAWYRPLTLTMAMAEKPNMLSLKGDLIWKLSRPGTCSASHFKRMGIEKIGSITVSPTRLRACFGELQPGISAAVSNISLANHLSVGPYVSERRIGEPGNLASVKPGRPYPAIAGLMQIVE